VIDILYFAIVYVHNPKANNRESGVDA